MNVRINEIVKRSGLTKTAFAKRLRVSQSFVSKICTGSAIPSDRTIADICKEFNVNEAWLRSGMGEMFCTITPKERIAYYPFLEWTSVDIALPPEDLYVLVWHGGYQIAKLARGISKDERSKMRAGELDDPIEDVWSYNTGTELAKRSSIYKACDEHGNNTRPYCWYLNCQGNVLFGQNVTHWAYLPENPYLNKKE